MGQRGIPIFVVFAVILSCTPGRPQKEPPKGTEEVVVVVAEPKFYVIGIIRGEEMQLFNKADPKRMWEVDGFVFEVLQPPEYAGRIIGMHHDGVLASGNPYELWEVGRRYEFGIPKQNIGKLSFGPCSLHGTRKVLPE